jgi:hypothetical protein
MTWSILLTRSVLLGFIIFFDRYVIAIRRFFDVLPVGQTADIACVIVYGRTG